MPAPSSARPAQRQRRARPCQAIDLRLRCTLQQEEEEEEPIGDVDLFTLTKGGAALTVHPKWLTHLQERQLGEDGQVGGRAGGQAGGHAVSNYTGGGRTSGRQKEGWRQRDCGNGPRLSLGQHG